MKLLICAFLSIMIFLISGCGGTLTNASRPNTTQQQKNQDHYECYRESISGQSAAAFNQYGGGAYSSNEPNKELYVYCMQARGYTIKEEWFLFDPR